MGSPGSGKTTVGRLLGARLGMRVVDADNDYLEKLWGESISDRLAALGDDAFLEAEGEAMARMDVRGCVVSLTGSNPLHAASFERLRRDGVAVFLDIAKECIVERMGRMKVCRIVGMGGKEGGEALSEVLDYRNDVYEAGYDLRVMVTAGQTPEEVAEAVERELRKSQTFVSTRGGGGGGGDEPAAMLDVVQRGLAPDGGLFVPEEFSPLTPGELERLAPLPYAERALRVMERFPLGSLRPSELRGMLRRAYDRFHSDEVLPVTALEENHFLMETYHGPTASFKDLSLQVTPQLLSAATARPGAAGDDGMRTGLIVATSGDTGTAALDGFSRVPDTPVVVIYPEGGVSELQEAQMRTAGGDVHVAAVRGADFDRCQSIVKSVLNAPGTARDLRERHNLRLSSGNSINWGRFLPQVVFTVSSYLGMVRAGRVRMGDPVDVCVPTGNFGNILGAFYAKQLGVPLGRLACASNENNVLTDFFRTGEYDLTGRKFRLTASPAIDILVSSNLERFVYLAALGLARDEGRAEPRREAAALTAELFGALARDGRFALPPGSGLLERVQRDVVAGWASEDECLAAVRGVHERTGRLIDPHTGVAKFVADRLQAGGELGDGGRRPVLIAATAHWAKFPSAMLEALGAEQPAAGEPLLDTLQRIETLGGATCPDRLHPDLRAVASRPLLHHNVCDASEEAVLAEIHSFLGGGAKK